jgi:dihydrofolate reductase
MPTRKVKLFIACSIDGFIAAPNDNLDFLKIVEKEGEDYGYQAFTNTIDTIIIGRRTFDYVTKNIGLHHYDNGKTDVYVLTRNVQSPMGRIQFYNDSIESLIQHLQSKTGKDIYCDGGAELINALLNAHLIDEMIISIVPIVLGDGIRLFNTGNVYQEWTLISSQSFDTGLVQLKYVRI